MLCATAKGQGSAAVVNRICQGISAGACAMGRVALLRAPRPHGHAPLMHGRGEFRWVARQQFWALRELCARVEPRARSPRLGPSAPDRGVRAGSREPRCALFFSLPRGGARHASAKPAPMSLRHRPLYICAGPPRVHARFWGRRQPYPRKATFRVGSQHREAPQARGEREHPRCRMAAEKTRPVENPCACVD